VTQTLREEIAMAICLAGCGIAAHRSDYFGEADAALYALRTWLDANGLVCVPREATNEMLVLGGRSADDFRSQPGPYPRTKAVWKSMISAAPDALSAAPVLEGEG
jgi:hypothetical protein